MPTFLRKMCKYVWSELLAVCRFSVTGNQNRPESFPHKHEKHTDINRSSSVKPLPSGQRVFRPSDLEYGETLGSGFFGLAKKVSCQQQQHTVGITCITKV